MSIAHINVFETYELIVLSLERGIRCRELAVALVQLLQLGLQLRHDRLEALEVGGELAVLLLEFGVAIGDLAELLRETRELVLVLQQRRTHQMPSRLETCEYTATSQRVYFQIMRRFSSQTRHPHW